MKKYLSVLQSIYLGRSSIPDSIDTLVSMARECDALEGKLAEDAKWMSEKFSAYANAIIIEDRACRFENPATTSQVFTITTNIAKLCATREALVQMIMMVFGHVAASQYLEGLRGWSPRPSPKPDVTEARHGY